ncbi:PhnD/SsuA/transferrin family substrate-binding protein [Paracoccus sp. S-4012]|uniref:ABC transporter substrate-binding protein n=1 Tax=Paracoccus sp. S-4012 TaxID=2665648 RepID=UPI0012B0467B|nr:ABC transporter substrate-binding protein [Paracoccus sp. S-4012]MRX51443.1 PhnD/SsuA/transferrin family substrate-binding protein [Paracoccus sp. S-4012]
MTRMHVLASVAGALSLLTLGSSPAAADDIPVIRVAWQVPANDVFYAAMEYPELLQGAGKDYEIVWSQYESVAPTIQAMHAGIIDAASANPLTIGAAIERGFDPIILGAWIVESSSGFSTTLVTPLDSGIETLADVAGKTRAASNTGGTAYYVFRLALEDAGLKEGQDYNTVQIPYPLMADSLLAGQAAVGELAQPFYAAAMMTGNFKPLVSIADVVDDFPVIMPMMNRSYTEQHPEAAKSFARDLASIQDWLLDPANRERANAATAKSTGLDINVLDAYMYTEEDYKRPPAQKLNVEALNKAFEFFHDVGLHKQQIDAASLVDPEFSSLE